jgi:hypothetical protein
VFEKSINGIEFVDVIESKESIDVIKWFDGSDLN